MILSVFGSLSANECRGAQDVTTVHFNKLSLGNPEAINHGMKWLLKIQQTQSKCRRFTTIVANIAVKQPSSQIKSNITEVNLSTSYSAIIKQ